MTNVHTPRLSYRAGLDGLRALAVAGVLLYHANVSWMPGGFFGVDLFFVLSGFLITSLLLEEWVSTGAIRLRQFWIRRARRLFPAVLVVIAFTLLATLTIARDDLSRTRADAISAAVYLTNWHEIIASHSYFTHFGRPSLLQHFWSLAVEEQFYVLWPLILIVCMRKLRTRQIQATIAGLAAVSFALMWVLYNPGGDPSRVYYGTDTRAFTLLIGALLAFVWPVARRDIHISKPVARLLEAAGVLSLAGVVLQFVVVHDYQPWLYHGGFLVMALCGAVLVGVVACKQSVLGRALGCGPLRWIGVRSYGIYLWHWPIMQLTRPHTDVPLGGAGLILAQAAATVAAAALSYRYIEMPIRSGAAQRWASAWLAKRAPRRRLHWVMGVTAGLATLTGMAFGVPAPTIAGALAQTATPAARASLTAPSAGSVGAAGRTTPSGAGARAGANRRTHAPRDGLPPGRLLAVGDSVMLGCAADLERALGTRLTVDAVVGRQADQTIARLQQYRRDHRLPRTVVVQIGDNGPVWYADMQSLRRVLAGVPRVVLVNVRVARSWEGEANHELSSYARTWRAAVLANWYASSTPAMLSDGVHPQIADRHVYVAVILRALRRAEARSDHRRHPRT